MLSFLAGIFLSLLPVRYRQWWEPASTVHFRGATVVSGLVQLLGSVALTIYTYLNFIQERLGGMVDEALAKGGVDVVAVPTVQFGMGYFALLEFALRPLTLLLFYLFLEGAVRLAGAAFIEQILPMLPLHVVAWTQERLEQRQAERALGPLMADTVTRGDGKDFNLRIASCRPKPNWDRLMTIVIEETFYEVAEQQEGPLPRRFVYLLRKMPENKVVRGLHHYDPNEVLPEK